MKSNKSRRDFLKQSSSLLLGAGGLAGSVVGQGSSQGGSSSMKLGVDPPDPNANDYKALVCIYLEGGNDSFNMLVPKNGAAYDAYAHARQGLALDASSVLSLPVNNPQGDVYGMHPAMAPLMPYFNSEDLAFVANMGPLMRPTTKDDYFSSNVPLPGRLFSHVDQRQQQETGLTSGQLDHRGWGGLAADRLRALNANAFLSPCVSVSGPSVFLTGNQTLAYHMPSDGPVALKGFQGAQGDRRRKAFDALIEQARSASGSHPFAREYGRVQEESVAIEEAVAGALAAVPPIHTNFNPQNPVAVGLKGIARMIQVRTALGMRRQLFQLKFTGWDNHGGLNLSYPYLLNFLSEGLVSFQKALVEIGAQQDVTSFTMSEFGRTLTSNGTGSDHGWGGHALLLGGAVKGRDIYGMLPDLTLGGPEDVGEGRMLPSTAVVQYGASMLRWMGLAPQDLANIFPALVGFPVQDLGFLP